VECRNPTKWRSIISRALATAAGNDVQIADAFRHGRYAEHRRRPILVKLNTVWDRRPVINEAHKLHNIPELSRVNIPADEPVEVRRRNTLERLNSRTEREHKKVDITNEGVSIVDGAGVFSLSVAFIRSSQLAGISTAQ
jgi:hypothetical protein